MTHINRKRNPVLFFFLRYIVGKGHIERNIRKLEETRDGLGEIIDSELAITTQDFVSQGRSLPPQYGQIVERVRETLYNKYVGEIDYRLGLLRHVNAELERENCP